MGPAERGPLRRASDSPPEIVVSTAQDLRRLLPAIAPPDRREPGRRTGNTAWPETLNTFRHEVAHVVHPNHSAAFWSLAHALGVTQRYASPPVVRRSRRYIYACPTCKRRIERRRRLRDASCAACDSRYNPRYAPAAGCDRSALTGAGPEYGVSRPSKHGYFLSYSRRP